MDHLNFSLVFFIMLQYVFILICQSKHFSHKIVVFLCISLLLSISIVDNIVFLVPTLTLLFEQWEFVTSHCGLSMLFHIVILS